MVVIFLMLKSLHSTFNDGKLLVKVNMILIAIMQTCGADAVWRHDEYTDRMLRWFQNK